MDKKLILFWIIVIVGAISIFGQADVPINQDENSLQTMDANYSGMVLKFNNSVITYSLEVNTEHYSFGRYMRAEDDYEKNRVRKAFSLIENQTRGAISFEEVSSEDNPDIIIRGLPPSQEAIENGTEGLAGPKEIKGNELITSEIFLYPSYYTYSTENNKLVIIGGDLYEETTYLPQIRVSWKETSCEDFPLTEVHEILHALGFGHFYQDSRNVMAPIKHEIQSCKIKEIDRKTIDCLEEIYTGEDAASVCSGLDLYPFEKEPIIEDFVWPYLPITYSVYECSDRQKVNIARAELRIEKEIGHDLYTFTDLPNAKLSFYCNYSVEEVLLNDETDFWNTGAYFPAAQPTYEFENDSIREVAIYLFAHDRTCGGIEVHEMIHALGIRKHEGDWLQREVDLCSNSYVIDSKSIKEIKEKYRLI